MMRFPTYPNPANAAGGGMVGAANDVYGTNPSISSAASGQQQIISPQVAKALVKGLKDYGSTSSGSAPIGAGAGQQSITGLSSAPTVMGGTPATAELGGASGGGIGGAVSNYALPALAMTGLVKAGNKLKIGFKDQGHLYSKLLKKFTGMF